MIEPPEPPVIVRPPQPNERSKSEPTLEQTAITEKTLTVTYDNILEMLRNAGFDVPQGAYMDVSIPEGSGTKVNVRWNPVVIRWTERKSEEE